jgi:poly-gamma-glutamate synthesis protein (capsule biosynthesis protein)
VASLGVLPYEIGDSGLDLLKGESKSAFLKKFMEISLPLDTPETLDQTWHAFLSHYGTRGFFTEIGTLMEKIKTEPQKGAAMFRNRLTTLQHYHLWKDFMTLMVEEKLDQDVQPWAEKIIDQWLTEKQ